MPYAFNPFTNTLDFFIDNSVASSDIFLPKYILIDGESIEIPSFSQYVVHDKKSLILNGTANIKLNEGSEVIIQ